MRTRWLAFLHKHGENELSGAGPSVRLIELDAQPDCPAGATDTTGVHISRLEPSDAGGVLAISECGVRSRRNAPAVQMARLAAQLDEPAVARLNGAYPTYCGEEEVGAKVLEIARGGRYQIIEWDCEIPDPIKPVYGRLLLLRRMGIDAG